MNVLKIIMYKFLAFIVLFSGFPIFAQEAQPVFLRVQYEMTHIRNLERPDNPHVEQMLLLAGSSAALFTSYDRILQGNAIRERFESELSMNVGSNPPTIRVTENKSVSPEDLYFFNTDKKFFKVEHLVLDYLYEETFPSISWEILPETKAIADFSCQKAVTNYKGREWHVWFSEQIPMPFGPWELGGLPGLILEAADQNREVVFVLDGIESVKTSASEKAVLPKSDGFGVNFDEAEWIILPLEKSKRVSKQNIERLKETAIKEPRQFYIMQQRSTEGFMLNASIPISSWGRRIPNPIALQD